MQRIFVDNIKQLVYLSNLSFEDTLALLSEDLITIDLLVTINDWEHWIYGEIIHRASDRFDPPFGVCKKPIKKIELLRLIKSINSGVYEYSLSTSGFENIYSISPTEIIIKVVSIENLIGLMKFSVDKVTSIKLLLELGTKYPNKMVTINEENEVTVNNDHINDIEEYLLSQ